MCLLQSEEYLESIDCAAFSHEDHSLVKRLSWYFYHKCSKRYQHCYITASRESISTTYIDHNLTCAQAIFREWANLVHNTLRDDQHYSIWSYYFEHLILELSTGILSVPILEIDEEITLSYPAARWAIDKNLKRRPVRKYGSSDHRPTIGAFTPFVLLSKSRKTMDNIMRREKSAMATSSRLQALEMPWLRMNSRSIP